MLFPKLRGYRRAWTQRSIYNWGNYDVSGGPCVRVGRGNVVECAKGKDCNLKEIRKQFKTPSFTRDNYPKYLQEIYDRMERPDHECFDKLVRHDKKLYKPSDKFRKYQRTWPECPMIWLRPRDTCCPDPEVIPPRERRPRRPVKPALTTIEKHKFQMDQFCKNCMKAKGCKAGRCPPDCHRIREVSECTKKAAPTPSFSEVCRHLVPSYCPAECSCLTLPLRCDGFAKYHRQKITLKPCTRPLIAYKPRLSYPF